MATGGRLISSMPFQSSPMNVGRRAFSSAAVRAFWHKAARGADQSMAWGGETLCRLRDPLLMLQSRQLPLRPSLLGPLPQPRSSSLECQSALPGSPR